MANKNIFCNTPWYEVNIYWDGSFGICCQESRKIHSDPAKYNIQNMSLLEWFNSAPVKQFRKDVLSDKGTDVCSRCQHEEKNSGSSRRIRSNQKSVIFTKQAFDQSYKQSPGFDHFRLSNATDGITDTMPIDLHIDLGNYCNLACKMCFSVASTRIASQYVRWGHKDHQQYLGNDWTKDQTTWLKFLNELLAIPKLNNIHFMGGETLITSRFEELVDFMILHGRTDLCFSFVTNGTTFNESLLRKLKKFKRVGIEVSIETVTLHNDYIRQGTDTKLVLDNIQRYTELCKDSSMSVTIRPAISLLSVGYYHSLLEYCLTNKLTVKSLIVTTPDYLDVSVLPKQIKLDYLTRYNSLTDRLKDIDISTDYNESNADNYAKSIKLQLEQVRNLLAQSCAKNQTELLQELVTTCKKWDIEFKFNAVTLYPELTEVFAAHGY